MDRTVALIREHAALREAIGCADASDAPSVYAAYRFTAKLRRFKPLLDACIASETAALHAHMPGLGRDVAIFYAPEANRRTASPDRMDALVWAMSELIVTGQIRRAHIRI